MDFLKNIALKIFNWILSLFRTRYRVTVSYNAEWGDKDDRVYRNVRKIITKSTIAPKTIPAMTYASVSPWTL